MSASLRIKDVIPGVHRVRAKIAGGRLAEYWYAWRGGPRILVVQARSDAELAARVADASAEAVVAYKALVTPKAAKQFVSGLITLYLDSAEYRRLADRTRRDIRYHLDTVRRDLGEMETKALEAPRARGVLISWRDKYKSTPKTADNRLEVLSKVTRWAYDRGEIVANPLASWPRLYRVDRADIIWRLPDLATLFRGQPRPFRIAVRMALLTGLRLGDLVRLSWQDVGMTQITLATNKSRGKSVVTIPITPRLQKLLAVIGRKDIGTVLTHSHGLPWTTAGLQTAMQRAKMGKPSIKHLRHHDLRGTSATWMVRNGFPLSDVAIVLGWKPERVANIARRYVTGDEVAKGVMRRYQGNKRASVM